MGSPRLENSDVPNELTAGAQISFFHFDTAQLHTILRLTVIIAKITLLRIRKKLRGSSKSF